MKELKQHSNKKTKKVKNNKLTKKERKLDTDLGDTFPASDPITKY